MAFPRVSSHEAVRQAMTEYDAIGAEAFHEKYGFGPALEYFLVVDGKTYDSKAILAVAQAYEHPELGAARNEFSGGRPVKDSLERLGFTVVRDPASSAQRDAEPGRRDAIHLVVKWSARFGADTVDNHRQVVEEHGAVWWGLRSADTGWRISDRWTGLLREQIEHGVDTYVFIAGDSCWRTRLLAVEYEREEVESKLIPSYYLPSTHYHLWVKLTDFQPSDRDELLRTLDPVNQAGRPVALGNQTNPLIVRFRRTPRVWWVNQGASFKRARDGGYLWAPIADKNGRAPDHWRAMRHLRPGDLIVNYANTQIRGWSSATSDASPSPRPDPSADQAWGDDGYRAAASFNNVSPTVGLAEIPIEWRRSEGRAIH